MIYILFVRNFIGNRYKESKWVLSIVESLILFSPVLFVTLSFSNFLRCILHGHVNFILFNKLLDLIC